MTVRWRPIVRRHPHGGYAVVLHVEDYAAEIPEVRPNWHVQFDDFREACRAAEQEETGLDFEVHQEVYLGHPSTHAQRLASPARGGDKYPEQEG